MGDVTPIRPPANDDTALVDDMRDAYQLTMRSEEGWIEGTLRLAAGLKIKRKEIPADREFGVWLAQNDLSMHSNDRTALLTIADYPELARILHWDKRIMSWRGLAEAIRSTNVGRAEMTDQIQAKSADPPAKPQTTTTELTEIEPAPSLPRGSKFAKIERGAEISAIYRAKDTRTTVLQAILGRGGKEIAALILEGIDNGILEPTGTSTKQASLRILIPGGPVKYCNQYDMTDQKQRTHVRDKLWPIILEYKDEVIAHPENLEAIITAGQQKHMAALAEARRAEETKRKVSEIAQAGEEQCIAFGVMLWPRMNNDRGTYTYDQIRAAAWTFLDWNRYLDTKYNLKSRTIYMRNMVRWLIRYHRRAGYPVEHQHMLKVFNLIGTIAALQEESPKGECSWPIAPKIESEF